MTTSSLIIRSDEDLRMLASFMKQDAPEDQPRENYTRTKEEVSQLLAEIRRSVNLDDPRGATAIVIEGRLLSLVLTRDAYHGYKWHLSIGRITGPGKVETPYVKDCIRVNNAFFGVGDWKSVPNPGKMSVSHFVGQELDRVQEDQLRV